MPDREKVIRGLLACAEEDSCDSCPYEYIGCRATLTDDALALLKEQEARVMTREEASETLMHGDFVIVEDRDTDMIWLGMRGDDNMELASGEYFDFDDLEKQDYRSEYGKSFRFWTSRPSPEQMRDTKWEGDES